MQHVGFYLNAIRTFVAPHPELLRSGSSARGLPDPSEPRKHDGKMCREQGESLNVAVLSGWGLQETDPLSRRSDHQVIPVCSHAAAGTSQWKVDDLAHFIHAKLSPYGKVHGT